MPPPCCNDGAGRSVHGDRTFGRRSHWVLRNLVRNAELTPTARCPTPSARRCLTTASTLPGTLVGGAYCVVGIAERVARLLVDVDDLEVVRGPEQGGSLRRHAGSDRAVPPQHVGPTRRCSTSPRACTRNWSRKRRPVRVIRSSAHSRILQASDEHAAQLRHLALRLGSRAGAWWHNA
jgi:hypothetical protein